MTVDLLDYGATKDLLPYSDELGRIIRVDRGECDVVSKNGIVRAVSDSNRSQRVVAPVTGDWVKLANIPEIGTVIEEVLPRKNKLSRRDPSDERLEQVLVSNLDLVIIVHGIDRPLPPGRIERLLTLAWSSQSQVIVVLTKVRERDELLEETMRIIKAIAPEVATLTVDSANTSDSGLEEIKQMLKQGYTAALIGESGAGKSSLANALLGGEILEKAINDLKQLTQLIPDEQKEVDQLINIIQNSNQVEQLDKFEAHVNMTDKWRSSNTWDILKWRIHDI